MIKLFFFILFWLLPVAIGYAYAYLDWPIATGIAIPAALYWVGCIIQLSKGK